MVKLKKVVANCTKVVAKLWQIVLKLWQIVLTLWQSCKLVVKFDVIQYLVWLYVPSAQ